MAAMPLSEEHSKLLSQCLEFCQTLADKSLTFSFSLTIGSSFSFSVDTRGKEVLAPKRKKKTPSTLRRDARRREELLKKKLNASAAENSSRAQQFSAKEAELLPSPEKEREVLRQQVSSKCLQFMCRGRRSSFLRKKVLLRQANHLHLHWLGIFLQWVLFLLPEPVV